MTVPKPRRLSLSAEENRTLSRSAIRDHAIGFALGTVGWGLFLVAGLPDYYQQYPDAVMAVLVVGTAVGVFVVARPLIRWLRTGSTVRRALLLAFYLAVPPAIYDYLYLGIGEDRGLSFLADYWYLTALYVVPAPGLLITAARMGQGFEERDRHISALPSDVRK